MGVDRPLLDPPATRSVAIRTGLLSIAQGLLIFVPMIVLGQAIRWPGSLDDPAATLLPRLLEEEAAVRFGYIAYLVYSILFVVAVMGLTRFQPGASLRNLSWLVVAFASASALARSIGIVRWLVPMPTLAEAYAATDSEAQRAAISIDFEVLNAYGGTIGEILGVSIFASLAVFVLCGGAHADRSLPRWITLFGFASATALLWSAVELAGIDLGWSVTFGTTMIQLWFLAVGLWLLVRGGGSTAPTATRSR
jgi:hypothetical protein